MSCVPLLVVYHQIHCGRKYCGSGNRKGPDSAWLHLNRHALHNPAHNLGRVEYPSPADLPFVCFVCFVLLFSCLILYFLLSPFFLR